MSIETHLVVAAVHGVVERRVARAVEHVHVHYARQQELRAMYRVPRRSHVQRCLVHLVARVYVSLAVYKHINRFLKRHLMIFIIIYK